MSQPLKRPFHNNLEKCPVVNLLISDRQEHAWAHVLTEALSSLATLAVISENEAVEHIGQSTYDMILVDATVVQDVPTLIAQMRERQPDARIVVGAADLNWEVARVVFRAGGLEYIDKSTSPQDLRGLLIRLLEGQYDPFALSL